MKKKVSDETIRLKALFYGPIAVLYNLNRTKIEIYCLVQNIWPNDLLNWRTKRPQIYHYLSWINPPHLPTLDIIFHQITTFNHKSSCGLCFWSPDPSIKASGDQKQRPHELLRMLWFDIKSISDLHTQMAEMLRNLAFYILLQLCRNKLELRTIMRGPS